MDRKNETKRNLMMLASSVIAAVLGSLIILSSVLLMRGLTDHKESKYPHTVELKSLKEAYQYSPAVLKGTLTDMEPRVEVPEGGRSPVETAYGKVDGRWVRIGRDIYQKYRDGDKVHFVTAMADDQSIIRQVILDLNDPDDMKEFRELEKE